MEQETKKNYNTYVTVHVYIHMWQSHVENEHYSYHILVTFFEFSQSFNKLESSKLRFRHS